MKKKIFLTAIVIIVVAALLMIPQLGLWGSGEQPPTAPPPQPAARPGIPVNGMVIGLSNLDDKVKITGTVRANESLELKSERAGKITHIYFEEGTRVSKGELLLRINDAAIKAQIEKQEFNNELYRNVEARQRKLWKKEAISKEEYDNVLNKLNTTKADIAVLKAQLEQTKIKAPFAGVIGFRNVSVGTQIATSTPIATLYDLHPAKVEFAVPSQYSEKAKKGQKIKFTTRNGKNTFIGRVYAVEPQIDVNTRTLSMRALVDNPQGILLPGQFLKVDFILTSVGDAILVPSEAVIPKLSGFKAYVVNQGRAQEVEVKVGIRNNRNVQIVSGLQAKDTLITEGVLKIYTGADVQIVNLN